MTSDQLALVDQLRSIGGGANQVADWVEADIDSEEDAIAPEREWPGGPLRGDF